MILQTSVRDNVSSKTIKEKAGLCTLNEMVVSQTSLTVWKSNKAKDPFGRNLFPIIRPTRSINGLKATNLSLVTTFWPLILWRGPGILLLNFKL